MEGQAGEREILKKARPEGQEEELLKSKRAEHRAPTGPAHGRGPQSSDDEGGPGELLR